MASGWGQQTWGFENYGTLGDIVVTPSGVSATTSIGDESVTAEINSGYGRGAWSSGAYGIDGSVIVTAPTLQTSIAQVYIDNDINIGWGGDTWGENAWGELSGVYQDVVGVSATTTAGQLSTTANANIDVTGIAADLQLGDPLEGISYDFPATGLSLTTAMGEEVVGIGVDVTGITLNASPGQATIDPTFLVGEGWGRDTFGNLGWGVNYSAINENGLQLTSAIGDESAFTDVTVDVTGFGLTSTFGNFSIQIDQDIFVFAAEDQLDLSLGNFSLEQSTNESATGQQLTTNVGTAEAFQNTPVDVTGISLSSSLGSINLVQSTNEPVTGQSLTTSIGDAEEIPAQIVGVDGIAATMSINSVTVTGNALVTPTGIALTNSIGSPNISAWAEIDPGVNNVWTEVDLAA